jgi:outer membrane protein OmpA-like peptidoglycan-associated protein
MINRIESIDAPMSNSLDHLKMPIANSIENIKQNADQFFTGEESSNAVSQASNGSVNGRQVSIDEALINTQFISDCTSSVYFPNTALFSFNKDEIEPSAKKELTKLKELLKKFPGRHVIITGHTDISGDNTPEGRLHNIELSERRATSVINWLVTNGGLDPNLLEARGAGSKFPLTLQIGQLGINRRVEVKLRCIDHAQ